MFLPTWKDGLFVFIFRRLEKSTTFKVREQTFPVIPVYSAYSPPTYEVQPRPCHPWEFAIAPVHTDHPEPMQLKLLLFSSCIR